MKNRLSDLNNHLFAQLERLSDEDMTEADLAKEASRAQAIVAISDQIVRNADLHLKAVRLLAEEGGQFRPELLPMIKGGGQ